MFTKQNNRCTSHSVVMVLVLVVAVVMGEVVMISFGGGSGTSFLTGYNKFRNNFLVHNMRVSVSTQEAVSSSGWWPRWNNIGAVIAPQCLLQINITLCELEISSIILRKQNASVPLKYDFVYIVQRWHVIPNGWTKKNIAYMKCKLSGT